jgi:hypothetical protein
VRKYSLEAKRVETKEPRIVIHLAGFEPKVKELKKQQEATRGKLYKVIPPILFKAFSGKLW